MVRKTKAEAEQTRQQIIAAARKVFHQFGVSRTSLEKVAQVAGVTRGAVYWHFANKAALFFAMREETSQALSPVMARLDSPDMEDPLDAIEDSLRMFIRVIERDEAVQQTFEIMSLRCEYVDEFAPVLQEVNGPCLDYLQRLKGLYALAAQKGTLAPGLDPETMAFDTIAFTTGLFHNWLSAMPEDELRTRAERMIQGHIALRRLSGTEKNS